MRMGLPESSHPFSTIPHPIIRSTVTRAAVAERRVRPLPSPVSEDRQ